MKLFFKVSFALCLLLLIAIVGVLITFDPNDYKDDISKLVKEQTGRNLSIQGDISLSLFPWIGLDLGAIEISNAKGFAKKPFAKMEHLQVRAKLWPLLEQRLEADTFVIEGLQLNLGKNKQGKNNWDDFAQNQKAPTATNTKQNTVVKTLEKDENKKEALALFALNGIEVNQAQLSWHDQQNKQKINIDDIQLQIGKLKADTKIPFNIRFHLKEKALDAKIQLKSDITFSSNAKKFIFNDTSLTSDLLPTALNKHLSPQFNSPSMILDLEKQTFIANTLNLSQDDLKIQIKLSAKELFSTPKINSRIILQPFNPRSIAHNLNIVLPEMADNKTLELLQAQLDFNGTLNNINLENIEIKLDQTQLVGHAKIKPTNSAINLSLDNINIDRYLPKPEINSTNSEVVAKNNPTNKAAPEAALIPIALLGAFNLDADLKVKKLQIKNTHWKNVHLASHSRNGQLKISPLTLQGYGSDIKSDVKVVAVKNNALISGNIKTKDIMAGRLLNDFTGKDKLKGKVSINTNFKTSGILLSQLKQNLNGDLKLHLKNGIIKGFDLEHQQNVLRAKLKGKAEPETPKPEETKIANLTASAIIKQGILSNNDLLASTPFSRIKGKGKINLVKETINYTASAKFTSSTKIVASTPYEKMNAIPLDVNITGTFDDPKIKPDFKKAINKLVDQELKKQKNKIKKDAKKKIKKKLENELKKLFKF